jgi:hypothetical protein
MKTPAEFLKQASEEAGVTVGNAMTVELAYTLMDLYARYAVKQDREGVYYKCLSIQYMKKDKFVNAPIPYEKGNV